MFVPRAERLRNLARQAQYAKTEKDPERFQKAIDGIYELAKEIDGLEGQGSLLDVVSARAYSTECISKRAYIVRAPSIWLNKTLVGMEEDLPFMPIEGFNGKPFIAMSPHDYVNRLKETQVRIRYSETSDSGNRIVILNEISSLITDATWDLVRHEDISADGRLLKAQAKLNSLLDKEELEK